MGSTPGEGGGAEPQEEAGLGRIAGTLWALRLALGASRGATLALGASTVASGVLPAAAAWVGKRIVDTVVLALSLGDQGWADHKRALWQLIAIEGTLVGLFVASGRAHTAAQAILRAALARRVTDAILDKCAALSLAQLEDPDVHDRLLRARKDAATRPAALVAGIFIAARNLVTLAACVALLSQLSNGAVLAVLVAGLPAFVAEVFFSQQLFEQERRRSAEVREVTYLETVLSREDFAQEVRLYGLAPALRARLRTIAGRVAAEDRSLALRRNVWALFYNLLGTAAFYVAYAWIVHRTVNERLTLGEMTMYLVVFRQAQQGVTSGLSSLGLMLDDHLYLRDLSAFLALPAPAPTGTATLGTAPGTGLRVEEVSFTYPGAARPALDRVSLSVAPGEMVALVGQNGSGKTTLLDLVTRFYEPDSGRILLDGLDVSRWDVDALRHRFALVFQDFVRFKMSAGENIGAGEAASWHDEEKWVAAGTKGLAHPFVSALRDGYRTPLGKWFRGGQELSGGQWQKIALSRAFMREGDPVVVLDEPAAALDPEAERDLFEHVRAIRGKQPVLLVSHRFGAVRTADRIVVLDRGRVVEEGEHASLLAKGGLYARLFALQAAGYET